MTIRVHMPLNATERVSYVLSPFMETFWSLHVLAEPEHHRLNQNWVRAMRKRTSKLRTELRQFGFAYRGAATSCGVPFTDRAVGSFEEELGRIRHANDAEALRFFTRSFYESTEPVAADASISSRIAQRFFAYATEIRASMKLAEMALSAPAATLAAFADLVERYWQAGFEERWSHYRPLLDRAVVDASERIARQGLAEFLRRLPLEVRVNTTCDGFTVARQHEHDVAIDAKGLLLLTPSFMVWPHVRVSCERPGIVGLAFAPYTELERLAPVPPPEALLRVLDALSDDTRLRVLRYLNEVPRSTQELSTLVNVTAPTLSEHLQRLVRSGVVRASRDGHYMVYELQLDLGQILDQLRDYLENRNAPG